MQIGVANGIPLNDVITGDDLVPAYDQSTGTEGYVNLTTAVQKAFSGSAAGTANGVLYLNGSKVPTAGSGLVFDGTNLGLGVTPSANWNSTYSQKAFQFGPVGAISSLSASAGNSQATFSNNVADFAVSAKYLTSDYATSYKQIAGQHQWSTAPSGTAGDAISFTQAMTLDANGRLGIGTTSPVTQLHVSGAGGQTIKITSTSAGTAKLTLEGTGGGAGSITSASAGLYLSADDASLISLSVNGSERARIDSSGNLLVGTTSTSVANGGCIVTPNNGIAGRTQLALGHASTSANGDAFCAFLYDGNIIGTITQNGTTAVAYNTSSDYRLKTIAGPVTNSGAYIDSLNPVEGTWKADGSTFVGLIAHEVQEVSRTSIATGVKDGEEMQAMDYSSAELIANLIAEVKSLRARVAALEA